jgi:hypothetical protein
VAPVFPGDGAGEGVVEPPGAGEGVFEPPGAGELEPLEDGAVAPDDGDNPIVDVPPPQFAIPSIRTHERAARKKSCRCRAAIRGFV